MKWGGQRTQKFRTNVFARYGRVCWLNYPGRCTVLATTVDHVIPKSIRPDLAFDISNGRPACESCNKKRHTTPAPIHPRVDERAWFQRSNT